MSIVLRSIVSFFGLSLVLFSAAPSTYPQTAGQIDDRFKLDEYGTLRQCDHSARLDNFAIFLQSQADATGYVVYYGPKEVGEDTLAVIRDYLVNTRGVTEERFKRVYAGPNDDLKQPRIQLWLVPPLATLPPLKKFKNELDTFTGLYDEEERWDRVYWGEGEGSGPPVHGVSFISFVQMLKKREDAVAYIVAFNGRQAAPRAWKRVAEQELKRLQTAGVDQSRVKIIYGGEDKETKIQQWILHKDQPPPVIAEKTEAVPAKAVQLQTLSDSELGEESEGWAFESLLDVLRTNDKFRAVLIVRANQIEVSEDPGPGEQIAEPVDPEQISDLIPGAPKAVDLLKVAEKWKAQLLQTHDIPFSRVIVLFAKPRDQEGSLLETWIVPAGADLPDPDAEPVAEDEESPVENGQKEAPIIP